MFSVFNCASRASNQDCRAAAVYDQQERGIQTRIFIVCSFLKVNLIQFSSSKGVEACLNVIEDLDNKQLALSCVKILISLLEFGFARRFIQNNGTATIFQLVSRCHSEDRAMQNHAEIVKNSLNLLILAKAKDKGICIKDLANNQEWFRFWRQVRKC